MVSALCFRVNEEYDALIYPAGTYNKINWDDEQKCLLGDDYSTYRFKKNDDSASNMKIAEGVDGKCHLRLIETKQYIIKLQSHDGQNIELPHLQNEGNKTLKCQRDEHTVTFQFINYLGRSRIFFRNNDRFRELFFEVVPNKMDYEDDYIELTESLAEHCAELLLEYSGSTSNLYDLSEGDSKTLLEQFIFLRQFCFSENIRGLFEEIKRNPDRLLVEDQELCHTGCGMPSKRFYTHPFSYARNWQNFTTISGEHYCLPNEVAITHKKESLDTPANRFLKFALECFSNICESLVVALNQDGAVKQTECRKEARVLHIMLGDILRDHFFDEIGLLDVMPQNNQVLQKREGYSQIFAAYSMIDLALQLNWKGENSVYEGESKNVALLYEYWLFFELYSVLCSIDGCKMQKTDENPFIVSDKGCLTISLMEGEKSCQSFIIERLRTKINLYYNRTFSRTEFQTTRYEGSYSRPFRPDYTLAVFPDRYCKGKTNGENDAVRDGAVSYIHFDAKYRITDLTDVVGKTEETLEAEEAEIEEEKAEEISNTYKRGDLLKMHTYNDAIRRTIGSYVLYPGNGLSYGQGSKVFSLYDEILPGVGAFAIKPSLGSFGEAELGRFITDLIIEKEKNSSRLNRLRYYSEMVLREPPVNAGLIENDIHTTEAGNSLCVIGYIRADDDGDYYNSLKAEGLLNNGSEFLFYYYAIKGNFVYSHHKDISKASLFRFYTNHVDVTESYRLEPILCNIESEELVTRAELVKQLNAQGYKTTEDRHRADFYYALKVKVCDDSCLACEITTEDINAENGNDSFSPHSPKVILENKIDGSTSFT